MLQTNLGDEKVWLEWENAFCGESCYNPQIIQHLYGVLIISHVPGVSERSAVLHVLDLNNYIWEASV